MTKVLHVLDHSLPLHSGYTFRTRAILKAQQAMGLEGCSVYVPARYAEQAKAILAEARAHPLPDEDGDDDAS